VRWSTGSQPAPLAPSCGACSSRRVCGSAGALAHGPCSWTSERLAREHRARSPAPRDAEPVHSAADRRRDDGRARAKHRPRELLVIGRGSARAGRLAEHYGGRALTSDQLREALARSDVVISSTSAPYAIVDRDQLEHALTDRGGANPRPLLLIDLAMPRDVAPAVAGLTGVEIYTIDDLRPVVERARAAALKCALEQISPLSANDREVLDAMTRSLPDAAAASRRTARYTASCEHRSDLIPMPHI